MKRFIRFLAVLVGGFVLFVGLHRFQPAAHPRGFEESIGYLAALLAIAVALDEITRRVARRVRSRRDTEDIRGLTPLPDVGGQEERPEPPGPASEQPGIPALPFVAAQPK